MRRHVLFAAILTAFVAIAADAAINDTVSRTFNVPEGGTLFVNSEMGGIDVTTGGSGVSVDVVREADTNDRDHAASLFKRNEVTFQQNGNEIHVHSTVEHLAGIFSFGSDLHIRVKVRVPARFNVDLDSSGGSINVGDLTGSVKCRTSGGSIHLARTNGVVAANTSGGSITIASASGAITAKTSGGAITIDSGNAGIDARTSGGSITLHHAGGPVVAQTSGGGIHIDEALDSIEARTSGGSITAVFAQQPRKDSKLSTSGGSLKVKIAPSLHLDIDAHVSAGGIHSDVPVTVSGTVSRNELVGKINGGGPKLELHTSAGSISLSSL